MASDYPPPVKRRRDGAGVGIMGTAPSAPAPRSRFTDGGSAGGSAATLPRPAAANIIAQLVAADGTPAGPQLDLPADVSPPQLEELLNTLLRNEERMPYAFYVGETELAAELGPHLAANGTSVEGVLRIVYQARARVRGGRVSGAREAGVGLGEAAAAACRRAARGRAGRGAGARARAARAWACAAGR
jgi:hypothetical protein